MLQWKIYIQLMKVFWVEKLSMLADALPCHTVTSHEEAKKLQPLRLVCPIYREWSWLCLLVVYYPRTHHDIFTLCWHHTDINISTGTVPLTAWGSGNVNHHLLPLQGANGFTWYFERDDVVISALLIGNLTRVNSDVMEEHNRIMERNLLAEVESSLSWDQTRSCDSYWLL